MLEHLPDPFTQGGGFHMRLACVQESLYGYVAMRLCGYGYWAPWPCGYGDILNVVRTPMADGRFVCLTYAAKLEIL